MNAPFVPGPLQPCLGRKMCGLVNELTHEVHKHKSAQCLPNISGGTYTVIVLISEIMSVNVFHLT